jgi:hypothetical protein
LPNSAVTIPSPRFHSRSVAACLPRWVVGLYFAVWNERQRRNEQPDITDEIRRNPENGHR